MAAFSQSPAEIRGRREGDSRIAPAGGSCVAGGCGLRWAVVVARGPSSQSSPVGRRGKTAPPLPSLNLSQGERGLMWRLPLGLSQRGEAGGRAIRESPLREVAGFDDPVRGRANACLTRPWRRRIVTTTNICSLRRETVEGALRTRRRLTSLPRRPGSEAAERGFAPRLGRRASPRWQSPSEGGKALRPPPLLVARRLWRRRSRGCRRRFLRNAGLGGARAAPPWGSRRA